jgi:hypothetical protein
MAVLDRGSLILELMVLPTYTPAEEQRIAQSRSHLGAEEWDEYLGVFGPHYPALAMGILMPLSAITPEIACCFLRYSYDTYDEAEVARSRHTVTDAVLSEDPLTRMRLNAGGAAIWSAVKHALKPYPESAFILSHAPELSPNECKEGCILVSALVAANAWVLTVLGPENVGLSPAELRPLKETWSALYGLLT